MFLLVMSTLISSNGNLNLAMAIFIDTIAQSLSILAT